MIECKRIYSDKASKISDAVGGARDKLSSSLQQKPQQTGIIALDISRRLTGGTDFLLAKDENVAQLRLSHEIDQFRLKYARYWSAARIKNERITSILFHVSTYGYLEDRELPSYCAYTTIQNIHDTIYSKDILFAQAREDIYQPLTEYKAGTAGHVLLR